MITRTTAGAVAAVLGATLGLAVAVAFSVATAAGIVYRLSRLVL